MNNRWFALATTWHYRVPVLGAARRGPDHVQVTTGSGYANQAPVWRLFDSVIPARRRAQTLINLIRPGAHSAR